MIAGLIGRALKGVRAGDAHLAWNHAALASAPACIALASLAFWERGAIPRRYAGKGIGDNISPPLNWSGVPEGTRELVLIMQDPDAPLPRPFVHLIATGIPPAFSGLPEGALTDGTSPSLTLGRGSFRTHGYGGPRAIPGHGPHRYVFQLVALDRPLALKKPPNLEELLAAIQGTVIGRGRLTGMFERA